MGVASLIARAGRLARKPPGYLVRRVAREIAMEADRVLAPAVARRTTGASLARLAGERDVDALWENLAGRPYPTVTSDLDASAFRKRFPVAAETILTRAIDALDHRLDLLGTGPVDLGETIDWLKDVKTGDRWPPAFCRSIDYVNKARPSDVKVPWEISRLQWLVPAGQAFMLTGDERYAAGVREILDQWIAGNPYAWTVNWSCTMEPALRILTWTWFFHVFAASKSWKDRAFRSRFLSMLYLHGSFTEKHIERSTINGNHLTADAAGLVFAGLFFRGIGDADRWAAEGWRTLEEEIALQVHPDGVDFEASSAYHRLVTELFLLPARYRLACGMSVSTAYANRLCTMVGFAEAYTRPDGTSPNWGDADDGRALPLGTQALGDHRYLSGLVAATFGEGPAPAPPSGGDEIAWHCGLDGVSEVEPARALESAAFPDGGVYILAAEDSHVFIDCGPVGLAGLGGHGHNDPLSFEAWLKGTPVIVDPGSFVYTASFEDRNAFRATASHNTPQIDGEEINRLHAPENLWNLHEDARAELVAFQPGDRGGRFTGRHVGYQRLEGPVAIERGIALDAVEGILDIQDRIEGRGRRRISAPFHLAPGVAASKTGDCIQLAAAGQRFELTWASEASFDVVIEDARFSPSYGVAVATRRIVFRSDAELPVRLEVRIAHLPNADR